MKFGKNQQKGGPTPKSEGALKRRSGPAFKTPKSEGRIVKKRLPPLSEGAASRSNGKSQPPLRHLMMNSIKSDLVNKIEKELLKKSARSKIKKHFAQPEAKVKYSSADDWEETAVKRREIDSILPTKTAEAPEESHSDEGESPEEPLTDESEEVEGESGGAEVEDPLTDESEEMEDKNGGAEAEDAEESPADEGSRSEITEESSPKRAGVQMFSGTLTLNSPEDAAEAPAKKAKKRKRHDRRMMSKLYDGDASALDQLPYFEDKVRELSASENLSTSMRKLLLRYQKCVKTAQMFKAGDLSFMNKATLNKSTPESKGEQNEGETSKKTATSVNKSAGEGGASEDTSSKKRYVLFVGNLPYAVEQQKIIEHFRKVGKVASVRIPKDKETNQSRGFAFVELTNKEAYEKALSLHHTFIDSRRINVVYTNAKEQVKKGEVKAKSLKLAAMRDQGLLAGSVKESQKRSARRAKKRKNEAAVVAEDE